MLPTEILCRNHLLGEHKEIHTQLAFVLKKYNPSGWIRHRFIFPTYLLVRHRELIEEFRVRKYNHQSPITTIQFKDFISTLKLVGIKDYDQKFTDDDKRKSIVDLIGRCSICHSRYFKYTRKDGESI